MKYIVINFRGCGKIKLPTNILKSIDVPYDFTVNRQSEKPNKRICIANGCYVDSLDKTIILENQLVDKKCYTSDDFNNSQLVDNGTYEFLEEILNTYTHSAGLLSFNINNGTISDEFEYYGGAEVSCIAIGYKLNGGENEIAYVYSDIEELTVGTEVYKDENGSAAASDGDYILYENINIEVPENVNRFAVENGIISELLTEEPVEVV